MQWNVPVRLTASMRFQASMVISLKGAVPSMPALVTRISIGPSFSRASAMAASTAALGNLPTRTSVAHGDYAYVKTPMVQAYLDLLRYGRARPGATIYPSISTELQVAISDVITGQQTPEAALDQAWHKLAP